ncbi:ANTAR domain-containing protein [Streptomyces sp. NPDC050287]|uniref:ANTAR domain-containing protein n=1 Tax=Streptomyces sp. NPDC050287 TaxID=3365608 RepID=UPI00379B01B3
MRMSVVGGGDDGTEREELERLRAEVRDLRARARVRPLIAQAQGMLRERYALPDAESAFSLPQRASQRSNVKMRTLAGALLSAPRPDPRDTLWFPSRVRQPEPSVSFVAGAGPGGRHRTAVLGAVLSRTLDVTGTDMGTVPLPDPVRGGLCLERHTGLTATSSTSSPTWGSRAPPARRPPGTPPRSPSATWRRTRSSPNRPGRRSSRRAAGSATAFH